MKIKFKYRIEYALLRFVGVFFNIFPTAAAEWIGRKGLGALLWYFYPYRFSVAYHNLGVVFPQMSRQEKMRMLRRIYEHYGYVFATYYIMQRRSFRRRIRAADHEGRYRTHKGIESGKGSIYCSIHYGHWEAFVAFITLNDYPATGIYKIQKNPLTDRYFIKHRQSFGKSIEHISHKAGMDAFAEVLRSNRMLGIAVDQNQRHKGVPVKFFGREFLAAAGAAVLHLRYGSPIFLVSLYIEGDGRFCYEERELSDLRAEKAADDPVQAIMQRLLKESEEMILKHPEQWLWFHRVWQGVYGEKVKRSMKDIFLRG